MKAKQLLLSLFALFTATVAWADVRINSANFPDANFRNWVLAQSYGIDGKLTDAEIAGIISIDVLAKNIKSLKGIEYFTALTKLNCYNNQLTSLDVSGCTALTELWCQENQLTALDVSKNTELTVLWCDGNQLNELDVSNNVALKGLNCNSNKLTALDVSKNTLLTELLCGYNQLVAIDVTWNTELSYLYCSHNLLTAFDVSKNTLLKDLYCFNNLLTKLDVSKNTALTLLRCYSNQLTALDVSQNTKLTSLYCYQNQIKDDAMDALVASLPIVSERELRVIYNENEGNVMTTKQVAAAKAKGWIPEYYDGNTNRWQKYAGSKPVSSDIALNETTFPDANFRNWVLSQSYGADGVLTDEEIANVTSIDVSKKSITSLQGIEYFTALKSLRCYGNQLTALDVSQNTALTWLYCFDNQLTELDVSKNTKLRDLYCYQNQIKDDAMYALVASLPTVNNGKLRVIYNENEGNVMTTTQVAAAKAKGWTAYYTENNINWLEYAGSEPSGSTGDLNGDFKIDIADAVSILNIMAEGSDDSAADLNGDGKVDIADFVSVLNLMAGQ